MGHCEYNGDKLVFRSGGSNLEERISGEGSGGGASELEKQSRGLRWCLKWPFFF
jgi:hypothetical protein